MATLIAILIAPFGLTLRGFVLVKLWDWFIVPTFAVPHLRIPIALGISVLVSLLTHQVTHEEENGKTPERKCVEYAFSALCVPLMALLMGWIFTLFI